MMEVSQTKQLLIFLAIVIGLLGVGWYLFGSKMKAPSDMMTEAPPIETIETMPVQQLSPVGMFATTLPAASGPGRIITLELNPDSTVVFTQDYQVANPPIVETGTWSSPDDATVLVTLDARDGAALPTPSTMSFIFNPMNAGVLTLEPADLATWGEAGLVLQNTAPFINTTWVWQETLMSDDSRTQPTTPGSFSLVFSDLGNVSATTDCNTGGGGYTLTGMNLITIGPLAQTMMFCEGSQEGVFMQQLNNVSSFIMQDGKLHLLLKLDSGTMTFVPAPTEPAAQE